MHGRLIFLVTSFAASVAAAPVLVSPRSLIEAVEPLMIREANEGAIAPVLNTLKREILERLDTVVERTVPANRNEKREAGQIDSESADITQERRMEDLEGRLANTENDKRDLPVLPFPANVNERRDDGDFAGYNAAAVPNDKRDDGDFAGYNAAAVPNDKRDDGDFAGYNAAAVPNDKRVLRDSSGAYSPSDKRQST